MLTVNNLYLGNKINNVGFSLYPGSIMQIKSSNSNLQTYFLKVLAGITLPIRGEIYWNDYSIKENLEIYHQFCVSYVDQKLALKEHLTVKDNIYTYAKLRQCEDLFLPSLAQFGLIDYVDYKCEKLTDNLKKRISLARLIIGNSKLWILDNPDLYLDEDGKERLINLISVRVREGGSIIIASENFTGLPKNLILSLDNFII